MAYSGNISGTVSSYSSGKTIKLAHIDRGSSVIYNSGTGTISSTDLGASFSIAFTFKQNAASNQDVIANSSVSTRVRISSSGAIILYTGGRFINFGTPSGAFTNPRRVVITKASGSTNASCYIDGTLFSTQSGTIGATDTFNGIDKIGSSISGQLDEVVLFNDVKDQTWVTADYNSGNGKYYTNSETNLVVGWHFDEGTGSSVADIKGSKAITLSGTYSWTTGLINRQDNFSATTTGTGDFTITGVTGAEGDPVQIYISGDTIKGALISMLPASGPVSGIIMEKNTVLLGDTNLASEISSSIMSNFQIDVVDAVYSVTSNVLQYKNGCALRIPASCQYTDSKSGISVASGQTGALSVDGAYVGSGPLVSPTLSISGVANNVSIQGSGDLTVGGTATLTATSLTSITNSGTLNLSTSISGDFSNTGTYTGSITFTGTTHAISGDTTFTNFICNEPDAVLTFENGKTYEFSGLTLGGTSGHEITLQSDSAGSRFTLSPATDISVNYVKVKDSNCSNASISAYRSINLGNNDNKDTSPHWVFYQYTSGFNLRIK